MIEDERASCKKLETLVSSDRVIQCFHDVLVLPTVASGFARNGLTYQEDCGHALLFAGWGSGERCVGSEAGSFEKCA